jgi:6,7-dimethyl-8-ribityllumazine synthase
MAVNKSYNSIRDFSFEKPEGLKIACVISEWHIEITENFYRGALNVFLKNNLLENNITKFYVPGSFELIFACKNLIKKDFDAIIAIGCIIQGETQHFEFVSTDDNIQQSIDRSGGKIGNKGEDSANAALKMISLKY